MKYNILINQYAAINSGLDLDLIDLSIFDFIKDFANSNKCIKMQTPEGVYFWISHKLIINEMPLLKINSSRGIMKRVDNLVQADLLAKHPDCENYGKTLYSFGENYELLTFSNVDILKKTDTEQKFEPQNESSTPPRTTVPPPLNDCSTNNTIINNNINDNSIVVEKEFSPTSTLFPGSDFIDPKENKEKKVAQKKETADRVTLFSNSDVYKLVDLDNKDYSEFEKLFPKDFDKFDLVYYFHSVSDWSDQKNMKRTKKGWIATVRTFIRGDVDKQKAKFKPEFQQGKEKINLEGAMEFLTGYD